MPEEQDPGPAVVVAAELGVLALALGTAASFTRLFVGWGFLAELALPVLACWASSSALRHARVPLRYATPASAVIALVVLTWTFLPGTSWAGLPTGASLDLLAEELRGSFGDFRRLVAPVEHTTGFLVVLASGLWVLGFFADTAAMRYRATAQATVPYAAAFVAAGVLAREPGRLAAAAWFGAGLAVYAATQRSLQASRWRWVRGEARRGTAAVLGGSAIVVAIALAAGLLVGPRLPGGTSGVVDLRELGRSGGARTVVSPFVSVRSLLGERSDQVVFGVGADRAAYWRLTALEHYDPGRDIWTSRRSYRRASGVLPSRDPALPPGSTVEMEQRVRVGALGGLWLPAAFRASAIAGEPDVSWDPASASLIARERSVPAGTTYTVTSRLPELDPSRLEATSSTAPPDPVHGEVPELAPEVLAAARAVTASATSPYGTALALQSFFREQFAYDEDVDFSGAIDPTAAFLDARRGFCQQFSSTFALLARALGLPSRVAVGFTPGDPTDSVERAVSGTTSDTDGPGFVVRGRHAHAWPEIWFDGVGWVPFEPTPGRGDPRSAAHTGVAPAQAQPPRQEVTTTAPTTTVAPQDAAPTTVAPPEGSVEATAPRRRTGGQGSQPWLVVLVVALAAAAIAVGARVAVTRARHRRLRHDPRSGRVAAAWDTAVEWMGLVTSEMGPQETPLEFAARAAADAPELDCEADLALLARAETIRRYGAGPVGDDLAASAEQAAEDVVARVREHTGPTARARVLLR